MADSSWGTGWPDCDRANIVTLVRADGLRLPLHRGLVDLAALLLDLTELGHGYDVRTWDTWGYACRPIRGSTRASNHSWGTAIDINATTNPMGYRLVTDMPRAMVDMWRAHGFRWGGDYRTRKDAMHYEFMGTVWDARRITDRLRRFLTNADGTPPPTPRPRPARPREEYIVPSTLDLRNAHRRPFGHLESPVRKLQGLLAAHGYGTRIDGIAGPQTRDHLVSFQRGHQLAVDAICGPATWRALIEQ